MRRVVSAVFVFLSLGVNLDAQATDVWRLFHEHVYSVSALPAVPDPEWRMIGAMDVDLDGLDEIVWHNRSTQAVVMWFLRRVPTPEGWTTLELVRAAIVTGASLPTPTIGHHWAPTLLLAARGIAWREEAD